MGSADTLGTDQRAQLYRTKLTSLVRSWFSVGEVPVSGFGGGAVATLADRSVILVEGDDSVASFGAGLIMARSAEQIEVWVENSSTEPGAANVLARQAQSLDPVDAVKALKGQELSSVDAAPAVVVPGEVGDADPWVTTMRGAGLDVAIRDGAVVGSLRGLEAARIVANPDGTTRLDVGVGHYDQEAFAMMNAELPPHEALAEVVRQITELRVADAPSHPINRLGRTRWLADTVVHNPSVLGLSGAAVVDILPDPGIRNEAPVALRGNDDGTPVAVVVTVGLDPVTIPLAADAVTCLGASRCELVVPARDHYRFLDEMAAMLSVATSITSLAVPWEGESSTES